MKNGLGLYNKFVKSLEVKPKPKVNIINTNESGKKISIIIKLIYNYN